MTLPLIVLAVCAIVFSVVLTPAWPWLHDYLLGERPTLNFALAHPADAFLFARLVAAGIGLGILIYRKARAIDPLEHALPAFFRFLENRMWLDELYDWTILAFARFACAALRFAGSLLLGWSGPRSVGAIGRLFRQPDERFRRTRRSTPGWMTRPMSRAVSAE